APGTGLPTSGFGKPSRPRTTAPEVSVEPILFNSSVTAPASSAHTDTSRCSNHVLTGSPPHTSRDSDRTTSGRLSTSAETKLGTAVTWATEYRFISAPSASG